MTSDPRPSSHAAATVACVPLTLLTAGALVGAALITRRWRT